MGQPLLQGQNDDVLLESLADPVSSLTKTQPSTPDPVVTFPGIHPDGKIASDWRQSPTGDNGLAIHGTNPKEYALSPDPVPYWVWPEFDSRYNLAIGDEILVNTTGTDAQHMFDHNRAFSNFSYKPNSTVKFDIGYIYISRLTKSNIDLIDESNFYLNFTYTLKK